MSIIFAGTSNTGKVRKNNEDNIYIDPDFPLYIVCDGMGGHLGGEVASQMAVSIISELIHDQINKMTDTREVLRQAILKANHSIYEFACQNEKVQGMGTTAVVLLIKDGTAYIGNVGDSRAYLINQGLIYQLTKDHGLVQEKINLGIYTREDAIKDTQKNVLVRTVGFEPDIMVDVFNYKINKNDFFLLCSDGLYGMVSDSDLIHLINENLPDAAKAKQEQLDQLLHTLVDHANENGGNDNISAIAIIAQN